MNTWKNQANSTQTAINVSESNAATAATAAQNARDLALTYSNATIYNSASTYSAGQVVIDSNGAAKRALEPVPTGDDPATSTTGRWVSAGTAIDTTPLINRVTQIAGGVAPTLFLDFAGQDYRIYSAATGLERKALTDIINTTALR